MQRRPVSLLLLALLLPAAGCSLEGAAPPVFQEGVFLDSPVEGLAYSGGRFTGTRGSYRYNPDATMQFFLGDLPIGGLFLPRSLLEGRLVTPVDLVEGAADQNNQTVVNIARFLLTLDLDENPDNGIVIERALHDLTEGLELDFTVSSFEFDLEAEPVLAAFAPVLGETRTLVDQATASEHLRLSLIGALAGRYAGTYFVSAGEDSQVVGEFELLLDRAGEVCGFVREPGDDPVAAVGTFQSNGSLTFSAAAIGGNFGGTVVDDEISGGWITGSAGPGQLEAEKQEDIEFFLGPERLAFVGSYEGSIGAGAPIAILVDAAGNLALEDPQLCGTILSIDGDRARFAALSTVGDVLTGTIEDGEMKGTSTGPGGSVTFTLTRP